MAQYFEPLILAAVGAASKTPNHQQQMNLLDQTKTLAESALQMLYTAKEAGGNPKVSRRGTCQWRALLCMWVLHGAHTCARHGKPRVSVQHPCWEGSHHLSSLTLASPCSKLPTPRKLWKRLCK